MLCTQRQQMRRHSGGCLSAWRRASQRNQWKQGLERHDNMSARPSEQNAQNIPKGSFYLHIQDSHQAEVLVINRNKPFSLLDVYIAIPPSWGIYSSPLFSFKISLELPFPSKSPSRSFLTWHYFLLYTSHYKLWLAYCPLSVLPFIQLFINLVYPP